MLPASEGGSKLFMPAVNKVNPVAVSSKTPATPPVSLIPHPAPSALKPDSEPEADYALFPAATYHQAVAICRAWDGSLLGLNSPLSGEGVLALLAAECHTHTCWMGDLAHWMAILSPGSETDADTSTDQPRPELLKNKNITCPAYGPSPLAPGNATTNTTSPPPTTSSTNSTNAPQSTNSSISYTACTHTLPFICMKSLPQPPSACPPPTYPPTYPPCPSPPPAYPPQHSCASLNPEGSVLVGSFYYQLMSSPLPWDAALQTSKMLSLQIPQYDRVDVRIALDR
eukprot:gene16821-23100_t